MRTDYRIAGAALAAGSLAALWVAPAARAAWDMVPDIGISTEVDDNARLVPIDQPNSTRTALDARLRLRAFGDRGEAFIEPRFITDYYADAVDEELESNDSFLLARATYDFQTTSIEFVSDYSRQSVLRSEIDSAIGDDPALGPNPIDTGAGSLGTFTDLRERWDLGFATEFTLSERTDFRLELSRIDVGYPEDTSLIRTPFEENTLAAVLTRAADQRNEVSASVYFSDFTADRNNNNTEAFGVQGSFARPLSQTWSLALDVGIARTDYSFIDAAGTLVDNAENSFTYGASFRKASEVTNWVIAFGRSIDPNSNGFLSTRDDVRIRVAHRFRPRLSLVAGLRGSQIETPTEATIESDRDYWRASVEFTWEMTPRWWLTTGLDHVREEFLTDDARSNSVIFGVRYHGLERQGPR
jgi:hypothetical protein